MEIDIEKLTCGIQLTDIERNVLEYLLTHLDQALKLGVRGVARENFTSTSTVMRLSRKLGYNGFIEMYYKLLGAVGGVSRGYEVNEDFVSHLPERKLYLWKTTRTCAGRQKKSAQRRILYLFMVWAFPL